MGRTTPLQWYVFAVLMVHMTVTAVQRERFENWAKSYGYDSTMDAARDLIDNMLGDQVGRIVRLALFMPRYSDLTKAHGTIKAVAGSVTLDWSEMIRAHHIIEETNQDFHSVLGEIAKGYNEVVARVKVALDGHRFRNNTILKAIQDCESYKEGHGTMTMEHVVDYIRYGTAPPLGNQYECKKLMMEIQDEMNNVRAIKYIELEAFDATKVRNLTIFAERLEMGMSNNLVAPHLNDEFWRGMIRLQTKVLGPKVPDGKESLLKTLESLRNDPMTYDTFSELQVKGNIDGDSLLTLVEDSSTTKITVVGTNLGIAGKRCLSVGGFTTCN